MKSRANERAGGAGDLTALNFGEFGPELDRESRDQDFLLFGLFRDGPEGPSTWSGGSPQRQGETGRYLRGAQ
jgi:hypothetical protein